MKIIVQNLAVNYSDTGSGRVVVLLHGWGVSAQDLSGIAQALEDRYRVIAIDLPGFGGSEIPKEAWHVKEYAQFVANFLTKIGIAEVYGVIGHSFGGRIAILGSGTGVINPQKVVLIGAAGIKHSDSLRNASYKVVAKTGKALFALPVFSRFAGRAREKLYTSAGSTDYVNAGPMKAIFANTISEDLSSQAKQIFKPTLLIWGEHDNEAPVADGEKFNQLIQNSKFHVIPNAGHFVHTDNPVVVTKLIKEFLA